MSITLEIKSKNLTTDYMALKNLTCPIFLTVLLPLSLCSFHNGHLASLFLMYAYLYSCYSCCLGTTLLPDPHIASPSLHSAQMSSQKTFLATKIKWCPILLYHLVLLQNSSGDLHGLLLLSSWFICLWPASY